MAKKLKKYKNNPELTQEDTHSESTDGKPVPRRQVPTVSDREKVQKAFEETIDEYSNALKKLADN